MKPSTAPSAATSGAAENGFVHSAAAEDGRGPAGRCGPTKSENMKYKKRKSRQHIRAITRPLRAVAACLHRERIGNIESRASGHLEAQPTLQALFSEAGTSCRC